MSGRRVAVSYLIVAGGCGLGLVLLWALDRRLAIDPETAALGITGAGALAGGALNGCLDRRATALESVLAALAVVATIAATNATGASSPFLAPITVSGGWLFHTAAVVLVAAVAGARLGARSEAARGDRVLAASAALMFAGTFLTLLFGFLCTVWAFNNSVGVTAVTFTLLFCSPYWAGMLLVFAFGIRAYRAIDTGTVLLGGWVAAAVLISELGAGLLHLGEIAAVAALVVGAMAVIRGVARGGADAAIGWSWGPPAADPELPRARASRPG